ncbi:MAG: hypothetical protein JNJ41_14905 [Bacteroidia bacterium]|nr:hypothetical protein [Bacteroidia bacterium]
MRVSYIFTLCFFSVFCFSQKDKIEDLKKLGRDSLIKIAVAKINEPGFDPKNYDRVDVKYNDKSLIVDFKLAIKFAGNSSCFYDAVYVALVGQGSGKSIQGFCDEPKFHKRTKAEQKKIDFVFDAINKDNEIGDVKDKKMPRGQTMQITEKITYYYIEVSDWSTYSHYKIDKVTGKISEANHKHYARDGEEKEEYQYIAN